MQAQIDQFLAETGYPLDELVADAFAGYVPELAKTREMLDSRYDDLKSSRGKPIPGDEIEAYFTRKERRRAPITVRFVTGYDFHPEVSRDFLFTNR